MQLIAITKQCYGDKDFHKNSLVHLKQPVTAMSCHNVLLRLGAQCVPTFVALRVKTQNHFGQPDKQFTTGNFFLIFFVL